MSRTETKKKPKINHKQISNDSFTQRFLNDYPSSFAHFCQINKEKYNKIYSNNSFKNVMKSITESKIKKLILDDVSTPLKKGKKAETNRVKKEIKVAKGKNKIEEKKKNEFINKIVDNLSLFNSGSFKLPFNETTKEINNNSKQNNEKENDNKENKKEEKINNIVKDEKDDNNINIYKKDSNASIFNFSMIQKNIIIKNKNNKKIQISNNNNYRPLYQSEIKSIKNNIKDKLTIVNQLKEQDKEKPLLESQSSNNMTFLLESMRLNNKQRSLRSREPPKLQYTLIPKKEKSKEKIKEKNTKLIPKKLNQIKPVNIKNDENKSFKKRGRKPKKHRGRKALTFKNLSEEKISATDKDKSLELKKSSTQEKSTYFTTEKDRNSDNLLESNEVMLIEKEKIEIDEEKNNENKEKEEDNKLNITNKKDTEYFNKDDQLCNNLNNSSFHFVGRKRALSNDFGNIFNNENNNNNNINNDDSFDMSILNNNNSNNNKDSNNFNNFNNSLLSPFLITQKEQNSGLFFNLPFDWGGINKLNIFDQSMFE